MCLDLINNELKIAHLPIFAYKVAMNCSNKDKFTSEFYPDNRIPQGKKHGSNYPGKCLMYRIGEYTFSPFGTSEGIYLYQNLDNAKTHITDNWNRYSILECQIVKNSVYKTGEVRLYAELIIPCYLAEEILVIRKIENY